MIHGGLKDELSWLPEAKVILVVASFVAKCETTMNAAVHTSTTHQPNLAFFSRPPLHMVGTQLPAVKSKESDFDTTRHVTRETYKENYPKVPECCKQKMQRTNGESGCVSVG
ncbi:hypothetical protein E2C01_037322 [Portunus trituberculatus]|uniref:Uncharacterized protein n=1 Tax=Portunus trituberculatus TaxID=210409 RepID=A0A5B7F7U5_PORTR|nr:hypothetical protein [Portunus trituberculatus]